MRKEKNTDLIAGSRLHHRGAMAIKVSKAAKGIDHGR
jgi:hypothetical protein